MQGFDGFLALGECQYLSLEPKAVGNQAQVVGTDALVAVAVDGDINRLIISNGDPHPQYACRAEPLLFGMAQRHRFQVDERRCQGKGQLCCLRPAYRADPQQAGQQQRRCLTGSFAHRFSIATSDSGQCRS
ncbi:hypothetical protein D3C76_1303850 [compost metagenome]